MDKATINAIDPARLTDIIADVAELHPHVWRRLCFASAVQAGINVPEAAHAWLEALQAQTSFLSADQVTELASELDALRKGIVRDVIEVAPMLAIELMWEFFTLAEGIFERTAEEATEVSDIFDRACTDLISIAISTGTGPALFATRIAAAQASSQYGEFRELIQAVNAAQANAPTFLSKVNSYLQKSTS
ncbi:hypothetical protein OVY01_22315 [Robbsia sp. Bb-Pol-6]|uniref:Uncharacterized protein n=1 Tax=Robbsia betulipollinis TaxID=2981849 RepID=A0ABT3ZTS0_9BURK|nr:DUF6880 family protein [Robbsia betulipollinis]MCY0389877.1 hypothetical protein [Robbsia betulipollinis]